MVAEKLNYIMREKHITKLALAKHLGMLPQSLSNKFLRDSFSTQDLVTILDFLDCQLVIESKPDIKIVLSADE